LSCTVAPWMSAVVLTAYAGKYRDMDFCIADVVGLILNGSFA
jgi:hypothetical protein